MTTGIESHELTIIETEGPERAAGYLFYGECSCHHPDGNGDGRQDYLSQTKEEIEEAHQLHKHRAM